MKELPSSTSKEIEMRLCADQPLNFSFSYLHVCLLESDYNSKVERVVNFAIKKYLAIRKYLATAVEEVITNISGTFMSKYTTKCC